MTRTAAYGQYLEYIVRQNTKGYIQRPKLTKLVCLTYILRVHPKKLTGECSWNYVFGH